MGTVTDIKRAFHAVESAREPLAQLAALAELERLVTAATRAARQAALGHYTHKQIAQACGVSRQAITKFMRPPAA